MSRSTCRSDEIGIFAVGGLAPQTFLNQLHLHIISIIKYAGLEVNIIKNATFRHFLYSFLQVLRDQLQGKQMMM
jgi:hypothetical protein